MPRSTNAAPGSSPNLVRPKKWYQRVLDFVAIQIAPKVIVGIMHLLYKTMRWEVRGRDNLKPFWDDGSPVIIAFWHGRLILMPGLWENKGNAHVLIGRHRNGELIKRVIAAFGIGAVRGSSNQGGKQARQELSEAFFQGGGQTLGFTPDGPHGPRFESKIGMAALSRKLGVPVVWLTATANPAIRLGTWDRFLVPLPFSKAIVHWAPAIHPHDYESLSLEDYRQVLDDFGRKYLYEADRDVGNVDPVDEAWFETALRSSSPRTDQV